MAVIDELIGRLTTSQFGAKKGGFNVLNVPKDVAMNAGDQFWEFYNNQWLQAAVGRGDKILAGSDPLKLENVFRNTSGVPPGVFSDADELFQYLTVDASDMVLQQLSTFGEEVKYLFDNNYKFYPLTNQFSFGP